MAEKVTLKDIAREMGVTTTTVHRALQGKPGVSEATREKMQQAAARMGYRTNYMAAALKRRRLNIAIALPEPTGDSHFYYGNMWQGVRRFLAGMTDIAVNPLEHAYALAPGANGAALKSIFENHAEGLDGVLTMGVEEGQSSYYMGRFAERNIPLVFVGNDMYKDQRFCCVKSRDEMAGSLAAELLTGFGACAEKIAIIGHFGQLGMADQVRNAAGFDGWLRQHAPHVEAVHIRNADHAAACMELERLLRTGGQVGAVYACSARYTVYVAQMVRRLGLAGRVRLVGSDCFSESVELLSEGVLAAIIDKKVARQSHLAMENLLDYILRGEYPQSSLVQLRPEVVLRSSVAEGWQG